MKVLVESVVSGKGAMPPKGLIINTTAGQKDYQRTVLWRLSKSGEYW